MTLNPNLIHTIILFCLFITVLKANTPTPTKIGNFVINPISNKLYVESCQNTKYKYNPTANPELKNPSDNIFTDLFKEMTENAITFIKGGVYVSKFTIF